jgi:hypothetical protein
VQSQTVLQTAVTQAQKELSKLTGDADPSNTTQHALDSERPVSAEGSEHLETKDTEASELGSSQSSSSSSQQETPFTPTTAPTLFSRLQSALPPNIVTTVTNHLPDTLKQASENIDVAQLRSTLFTEFQRVQGVTRVQAEEYAHNTEALLREAIKDAREVIRDAVKIIPPNETQGSHLVWDGTDMWSLPSETSDTALPDRGLASDTKPHRGSVDAQLAVATRAEFLLKRLKHDPAIIRHDPEADPGLKELYFHWISSENDTKEGGIDGKEWSDRISKLLDEPGSGLRETRDALGSSSCYSFIVCL